MTDKGYSERDVFFYIERDANKFINYIEEILTTFKVDSTAHSKSIGHELYHYMVLKRTINAYTNEFKEYNAKLDNVRINFENSYTKFINFTNTNRKTYIERLKNEIEADFAYLFKIQPIQENDPEDMALTLDIRTSIEMILNEMDRFGIDSIKYRKDIMRFDNNLKNIADDFAKGGINRSKEIIDNYPKEWWWWHLDKIVEEQKCKHHEK